MQAHSPLPVSLAGRCHPSLTNFPALAALLGPCSPLPAPDQQTQMRQGQIWGCKGIDQLSGREVNALAFIPPRTSPQIMRVLLPQPHTLKSQLQSRLHFANKTHRSPFCLTSARPHFHVPDSFQGWAIPWCPEEGGELPQ